MVVVFGYACPPTDWVRIQNTIIQHLLFYRTWKGWAWWPATITSVVVHQPRPFIMEMNSGHSFPPLLCFMVVKIASCNKSTKSSHQSVTMLLRSFNISTSCQLLCITAFAAISCFVRTCSGSCNHVDRDSLSAFKLRIAAASPLNWTLSADCCSWEGVTCDDTGRVTFLWLPSMGISGVIPPSICNLSSLSTLNLSHNQLSGSLPNGFFACFNHLQVFDLSRNRISGRLTESDKLPSTIQMFNLSDNLFDWTIPSSFFQQALHLESFDISHNRFLGSIPSSICSYSTSIRHVDLSNNKFSGRFPPGLGHCSKLQNLRAGFNDLSGEVPEEIYGLLTLQEIYLPGNRLSGQIDERIVYLVNLKSLALHTNHLAGMIPRDIGRLSRLEILLLHGNELNGTIPLSLKNCTQLVTLILRENLLEGELSVFNFSRFVQLRTLDLGFNLFTGSFPASLFTCKTLIAVRLADNNLIGEIPHGIEALKSLSFLSVSNNGITNIRGAIEILTRCKNLSTLLLSNNFYGEELPGSEHLISSGEFQNLHTLSLRSCRLTGLFPLWLSKLTNLAILDMSNNCITGSIPGLFGKLPNLFFIQLSNNRLSGSFPLELTRLPRLASQPNSEQAEMSYELPLYYGTGADLQYNTLKSVPRSLYLSNNSISGSIPEEIGHLKFIAILRLNQNGFTGSIPATLCHLIDLEILDLSGNHLSGEIPTSLQYLYFLSFFNVAYNNLSGHIPTEGQFNTFTSSSYKGNPELCGEVVQRSCQHHVSNYEHRKGHHTKNEVIGWLSFEISYVVSFILTALAMLKFYTI